jgi:hypothetical protein
VTYPLGKPTVLIVDGDLGFIWWLGDVFAEAGCRIRNLFIIVMKYQAPNRLSALLVACRREMVMMRSAP